MSPFVEDARRRLGWILVVVGAMWVIYALSWVYPPLVECGLRPRTARGLVGIVTMPFLHARIGHLLANTLPLIVLLGLLCLSRTCVWQIVLGIVLLGGTLLWLCGRSVNHIGASGLISGLIAFLVVRGCLQRRFRTVIIAIVTFFLYGGTLMWGIIPGDPLVSWDGHLCGALAGGLVAFGLARWSWNWRLPRCVPIRSG